MLRRKQNRRASRPRCRSVQEIALLRFPNGGCDCAERSRSASERKCAIVVTIYVRQMNRPPRRFFFGRKKRRHATLIYPRWFRTDISTRHYVFDTERSTGSEFSRENIFKPYRKLKSMPFAPQGPAPNPLAPPPPGAAGVRGRPAGNGPPRCLTLRRLFDIAGSRLWACRRSAPESTAGTSSYEMQKQRAGGHIIFLH